MKSDCYSDIASVYHMIFENWDDVIKQQKQMFSNLLQDIDGPVLDCSCGIGTQSLALGMLGFKVDGVDLSQAAIERAQREAIAREISIDVRLDDMRFLKTAPLQHYGIVISLDNSLPHLDSDEEILMALSAMRGCLKKNGILFLSVRDYGKLMKERPSVTQPKFFLDGGLRRTFHQIWDWQDERRYKVHFYITYERESRWHVHHSVGQYRAISVDEVILLARNTGFIDVEILEPKDTGFYQPMIRARAP
jgi:glycine/sarcosine N-methyltransferase